MGSIFSSDASLNSVCYLGSDESTDYITNYRRKRRTVDYKTLYDEMFGKESNEQSEDEDWGPYKKKKVRIAPDLGMAFKGSVVMEKNSQECTALQDKISWDKRSFFRIPPDAIEKLRQIFAENELPSWTVKKNLSKQLGISVEKIDKWFKNARYAAIKIRKTEATNQPYHSSDISIKGHKCISDEAVSLDNCLLPLASIFRLPQHKQVIHRRENLVSASFPVKKQKGATTVRSSATQVRSHSRNSAWRLEKHKITRNKDLTHMKSISVVPKSEQLHINEMQILWVLERRLHLLKQRLLACKNANEVELNNLSEEKAIIYVPVVEVKEKAL